jgi:DNA-binding NarL/FixJ family response regulator
MRIRVLVADMTPMLRDIISDAVTNETDLELVGTLDVGQPLLSVLTRIEPDVLILRAGSPNDTSLAEEVLARWPRTKVLMITHDGRGAVLHTLRPYRVVLGDVSSESLLAAIRRPLAG